MNEKPAKNNLSGVSVFYAAVPNYSPSTPLYPKERSDEVFAVKNPLFLREKYYAWELLKRVLEHNVGLYFENLTFSKSSNGKWKSDAAEFSISHSNGVVAVAISSLPVGVDIQEFVPIKQPRMLERLLHPNEKILLASLSDKERNSFFINTWTKKESIYKLYDSSTPLSSIDTTAVAVFTTSVSLSSTEFSLSVAGDNLDEITIFPPIIL